MKIPLTKHEELTLEKKLLSENMKIHYNEKELKQQNK